MVLRRRGARVVRLGEEVGAASPGFRGMIAVVALGGPRRGTSCGRRCGLLVRRDWFRGICRSSVVVVVPVEGEMLLRVLGVEVGVWVRLKEGEEVLKVVLDLLRREAREMLMSVEEALLKVLMVPLKVFVRLVVALVASCLWEAEASVWMLGTLVCLPSGWSEVGDCSSIVPRLEEMVQLLKEVKVVRLPVVVEMLSRSVQVEAVLPARRTFVRLSRDRNRRYLLQHCSSLTSVCHLRKGLLIVVRNLLTRLLLRLILDRYCSSLGSDRARAEALDSLLLLALELVVRRPSVDQNLTRILCR